jgi:hypothetical protein
LAAVVLVVLACGSFATTAWAAKLHVVFAVDTKAERVGRDLTADAVFFSLIINVPQDNLKLYYVDPEDMSETTVLTTVRRVPVEADDAVMFYYIGHGAYDATQGTYMTPSATTNQVLSATRMVQELQALGGRFSVVVFDCCNRERAPKPTKVAAPAPGLPLKVISPLFDELFFKKSGAVLVVSSSPNEYALVKAFRDDEPNAEPPAGPIFTSAFGKTLDKRINERLSWPKAVEQTQSQVDVYFRAIVGDEGVLTLDDGVMIRQNRQTVQTRYFR